ncbi:MAG: hypothetical protein JWM59_4203 [Verrucomicrobiales bacterium]|nr:hypothetical protein [Verrucomicrobiales bacterium]
MIYPVLRVDRDLILLEKFEAARPHRDWHACPLGTMDSGWRMRRRPLLKGPLPSPALRGLAAAWQRLGVAVPSAETLADLLLVLRMVPASPAGANTRSAAPPGLSHRGPVDIRGGLGCGQAVRRMLDLLHPHRHEALRQLRRQGLDPADFRPWLDGDAAPPANPLEALPAAVAEKWVPWLKPDRVSPEEGTAFLRVIQGVELDREALTVSAAGTGWLPLIAGEPPEMRCALLRVLLATGALERNPPPRTHRLLATLRCLSQPDTWLERARWTLKALAEGAAPAYIAATLRWHLRHSLHLPEIPPDAAKPPARLLRLLMRHGGGDHKDEPAEVWRALSLDRDGTFGQAARAFLGRGSRIPSWGRNLFSDFSRLDPKNPDHLWRRALYLRLAPRLLAEARVMNPENRHACWCFTEKWINDVPETWPGMEEDLLFWLRRTGAAPVALPSNGSWFLACCCTRLTPQGRALLRTWTAEDFRRFRRLADSWGFNRSITDALVPDNIPREFLSRALHRHMRQMVAILSALSQLRPEHIRRVWQSMAEHPLCSCHPETMPLREAVVLLEAVSAGRQGVPALPGSVRRLIAETDSGDGTSFGKAQGPVPAARFAEARSQLAKRWWQLAVQVLDQLVDWEIRRGFPGLRNDSGVQLHTLCMAISNRESEENAAATRSIVRAGSHGHADRNWALDLPLNRRWLATHPKAGHSVWREGFAVAVRIPEAGEITLSFEDDLQEILRMGTRFGTCLSLGGCNDHSAAAVALDANKRLLQARDASGKIIARQLLALSEEGMLVCFAVYAHRSRTELNAAFATCNLMLSQVLRLPIWRSREDYEVAGIVCKDWYDDGVWDYWKESVPLAS